MAFTRRHTRPQASPNLNGEDFYQPLDVETLVLPESKFYEYPEEVPIEHWQLRNLISSPEPNIVNYISKHDIIQLDLEKQTRTQICTLPFIPRCSASGHGFIVVGGGPPGSIAVINVNPPSGNGSRGNGPAEVDDPLPIFGRNQRSSEQPPTVKVQTLGNDIVNSVSIHKLAPDSWASLAGIKDDVVAVFTNNDKTVRIYSLTHGTETFCQELPFPTNHATISPDGERMVVVGDWQHAFFFERERLPMEDLARSTIRLASFNCEWKFLEVLDLHKPRGVEVSEYFSTAWSPDGWTCAVASQIGYVTVVDLAGLLDDRDKAGDAWSDAYAESIRKRQLVVPSSRPSAMSGPGAVRAMSFLPAPWDLLVWIEAQGRVCVADLRDGMKVRQVLALDPEVPGTLKIPTVEFRDATPTVPIFGPLGSGTRDFGSGLGEEPRTVNYGRSTTDAMDSSWDAPENQRLILDLGDIRVYQTETIHEFTGPRPISRESLGRRELAAAAFAGAAAAQRALALTQSRSERTDVSTNGTSTRRSRSRSRSRTRSSWTRSPSLGGRTTVTTIGGLSVVRRIPDHDMDADSDSNPAGEGPSSRTQTAANTGPNPAHPNHPPLPPHHNQHQQQFLRPIRSQRTWAEIVAQRDPIYLGGGATTPSNFSSASSSGSSAPSAGASTSSETHGPNGAGLLIEDRIHDLPGTGRTSATGSIGGVADGAHPDVNALRFRRQLARARERERERMVTLASNGLRRVPANGGNGIVDGNSNSNGATRTSNPTNESSGNTFASYAAASGLYNSSYSIRPPVPQEIQEYQRRYRHVERDDVSSGFSTAGLVISDDGRRMYVGTKRGLFEFKFNLRGRLSFQKWEMC